MRGLQVAEGDERWVEGEFIDERSPVVEKGSQDGVPSTLATSRRRHVRRFSYAMVVMVVVMAVVSLVVLALKRRVAQGVVAHDAVDFAQAAGASEEADAGWGESHIMLAHDRTLCVEPNTGSGGPWHCHMPKAESENKSLSICKKWRMEHYEGKDFRFGWQLTFSDNKTTSPCGCHCCRRQLHGRPEKGGGMKMRVWPCDQGSSIQQLIIPFGEKGPLRLASNPHTCLTMSGSSWPTGNSGDLMLWPCGKPHWTGQIWLMPKRGQGEIRAASAHDKCIDASRVSQGHKEDATLQVADCALGSDNGPNQLFLLPAWKPAANKIGEVLGAPTSSNRMETVCDEINWPFRVGEEVCDECKVPVKLPVSGHKSCRSYCESVGRECAAAFQSGDQACSTVGPMSCDAEPVNENAICQCGERFLRGNYGSLSEFWVAEDVIRQRVRDMFDGFGILEFQFYGAFEGFSRPPAKGKQMWKCAMQDRLVRRSAIKAAVDEISSVRGRSFLQVHAAAVNPGDTEAVRGHWVMPPEDVAKKLDSIYFEATVRRLRKRRLAAAPAVQAHEAYEQTYEEMCGCNVGSSEEDLSPSARLMDVVNINAAWALRIVPTWAKFVADLGMQGIHWDSFGDFGHSDKGHGLANPFGKGAPKPDIPGFLRAALPILQEQGLVQTLTFVDGYGWDPTLLNQDPSASWSVQGGRAITFPFWEVWKPEGKKDLFEAVGSKTDGFVMAMYPGYSKFHCCAKNERQNAGDYGVQPFDLGLRRWQEAIEHGGSYHFIVDGRRYLQSPYVPDAVRFREGEAARIQAILKAAHHGASHSVYIFAASSDGGKVVRQPLFPMSTHTEWEPMPHGHVQSLTVDGEALYAVSLDHRVMKLPIATLTSSTPGWTVVSAGHVKSVAIHGDVLYAVAMDNCLVKQTLSKTTEISAWEPAGPGHLTSIHIFGDSMYGTSEDMRVVRKKLSNIALFTPWDVISTTAVTSVAIFGSFLYATDSLGRVVKQPLADMTEETPWTVISKAGVSSLALQRTVR